MPYSKLRPAQLDFTVALLLPFISLVFNRAPIPPYEEHINVSISERINGWLQHVRWNASRPLCLLFSDLLHFPATHTLSMDFKTGRSQTLFGFNIGQFVFHTLLFLPDLPDFFLPNPNQHWLSGLNYNLS